MLITLILCPYQSRDRPLPLPQQHCPTIECTPVARDLTGWGVACFYTWMVTHVCPLLRLEIVWKFTEARECLRFVVLKKKVLCRGESPVCCSFLPLPYSHEIVLFIIHLPCKYSVYGNSWRWRWRTRDVSEEPTTSNSSRPYHNPVPYSPHLYFLEFLIDPEFASFLYSPPYFLVP